jgi:Bacterial EndoU nuclease
VGVATWDRTPIHDVWDATAGQVVGFGMGAVGGTAESAWHVGSFVWSGTGTFIFDRTAFVRHWDATAETTAYMATHIPETGGAMWDGTVGRAFDQVAAGHPGHAMGELGVGGILAGLRRGVLRSADEVADAVNLVSPERTRHILDGEILPNGVRSGGHRFGTGFSGKSEFPESWTDATTMHHISDIATDPDSIVINSSRSADIFVVGSREGVTIQVLLRNDEIWSAYPISVPRNPK